MSLVRYSRLLKVIALLQSRRQVSRSELEAVGEYPIKETSGYYQNRTLQNDLDFLIDFRVCSYKKSIENHSELDYRNENYI